MSFTADSVGTPLVRLARFSPDGTVFAKAESMLPTGSAYDRIAARLLADVSNDAVVVEGSGSLALAFAAPAASMKKKLTAIVPKGSLPEHVDLLKRYEEITLVEVERNVEAARQAVEAAEGEVLLSRDHAEAATAAFAVTLGAELGAMLETGPTTTLVAPVHSGALLLGAARGMADAGHDIQTVGTLRPAGETVQDGVATEAPEGVGRTVVVEDKDAHESRIELARAEGILAGMGSAAAARVARGMQQDGSRVVTIIVDAGDRYFSVDRKFGG